MSGNGTDLGHIVGMFQQIMATLAEHGRLLQEHGRLLQEHGRRFDGIEADVRGLRAAVEAYHGSVIGHGVLISEHDGRLGRVEDHLQLPPMQHG